MAARINWEKLAEDRLAGKTWDKQAQEHDRMSGGNGGHTEHRLPEKHPVKVPSEAKTSNPGNGNATAEARQAERREPKVLPTAEQGEILQEHPHFKIYREGMRLNIFEQLKDSGLTDAEKQSQFDNFCKEDLQDSVKFLLENGELKNWQEFIRTKAKKPVADIVPEGNFGDREVAAESKYLDRDAMGPLLGKFYALTEEQREQSGIDINMLFYFLEGTGKVKQEWPVKIYDDREIGLEDYLAEAKKLENFLSPKEEGSTEVRAEVKDWREVKRETEVFVIGDLHGNIEALEGNLEKLGLIKNDKGLLEWSGGKARVIFEGDILADRNTNGLNILYKIGRLQEQAKKAGGEIEIIAGNHDDFAISFLMDVDGAGNADAFESCRQGGYLGLLELARYGSPELRQSMDKALAFQAKGSPSTWSKKNMEAFGDLNAIRAGHPAWQMLKAERQQILENMRNNPKGRQILEVMCNMKLATRKDDTLIIHTNPTEKIAGYLQSGPSLDQTIKFVNDWYQGTLRKCLIDGGSPKPEFMAIKGLFLDTDNREDFTNTYQYDSGNLKKGEAIVSDMVAKFRTSGVNALVHGHSDEGTRVRGKAVDFPIISVDFSAYKSKGRYESKSVLKIAKDGKMQIGKDMETIRS